ncbi:hypothetical protein [Mucilaginibacter lacusdianchii]|uniref:hypothetical protein n=1 Tax=Mucilaginibacter lacusdianchii TaxID=2684211 RepID=UPI0018EED3D7|nr:hypothetical protein [Mucilaginibacter sp. JXJ CY 39]
MRFTLVAVAAISFASCSGNTSKSTSDSTAMIKDSSINRTSGDTSVNMDSARADSNTMLADTSTTKP